MALAETSSSFAEDRLTPAERVTRQIKAALERGVRPWVRPWSSGVQPTFVLPRRANGLAYRGVNVLALWAAADACGFASPFWLSFKQALAEGGAVRKGERGSFVIFYKQVRGEQAEPSPTKGEEMAQSYRILRGYTVFNADQIDGLPAKFSAPAAAPPAPRDAEDARLSAMFAKVPATVRYGGDRAFYAPGPDFIQMPSKAAFADPTQHWATLGHELAHWTRAKSRLDRDFGQKRFGDAGYSLEELVAELTSAFIGAVIGLPADHIEDHAGYIAHWLETLTDTPAAFLTAAAKAQTAADYLLAMMGVKTEATPCIGGALPD